MGNGKRYGIWLGGVTLSLLGSQLMAFAMIWSAGAWGGAFAGAVLTAINLPRALLLLAGGALADRIGAWRVMIASDVTMAGATAALGAAVLVLGVRPYLLLAVAAVIGTVDAFYLPGSGSMPRRLVAGKDLARAMSARQVAGQLVTFAGPAAGGVVVAAAGLAAAAFVNAATFLVMAVVLIGLRPRSSRTEASAAGRTGGLRVVASDPLLRAILGLVAVAAGFLLPVSGLLIPLLARERHWGAGTAGLLAGAVALGIVAVAVLVTATGSLSRPGRAAAAGLALAAAGVAALACVRGPAAAVAAAAVVGVGSGVFTTRVGPLVLGSTPATHLARVQSVLVLGQSVPLLVTNAALGSLADLAGVRVTLSGCAVVLAGAAALGLRSRVIAHATA